jgi:lysophospholipase L1-like esterase
MPHSFRFSSFSKLLFSGAALLWSSGLCAQRPTHFTCGAARGGATRLTLSTTFPASPDVSTGFGFDLGLVPEDFANGACSSRKPFFFSVAVPDGNYVVTVVLGGKQASTTTLRAESRRLLLDEQTVPAGGSKTEAFALNVRTPPIAGLSDARSGMPAQVHLKPRELGALDWDAKLTLEFNGEHPSVRSITVAPAPGVPTLYLAGDSTVVDQDKEPWAAWGQMLPMFFKPALAVSNQAESGETIKSFQGERRFDKIFSTIRPGDFLMIQFAHNDQKPGSGFVPAHTEFKDLLNKYIDLARKHGATPILVTAMNRRAFDEAGQIRQTLGDYPQVMREVAAQDKVALIDLNAQSRILFEAMGPEGTLQAFVHYPANTFPGQDKPLADDTHFNSYGAYELARIIVQSIEDQHLALAKYLRPHLPRFNPAAPDNPAAFHLPASPSVDLQKPYER